MDILIFRPRADHACKKDLGLSLEVRDQGSCRGIRMEVAMGYERAAAVHCCPDC